MNIPEAIEILTMWNAGDWDGDPEELDKAEKLAIEALKRLQTMRSHEWREALPLLPGETRQT